jgi:hypothetical protein
MDEALWAAIGDRRIDPDQGNCGFGLVMYVIEQIVLNLWPTIIFMSEETDKIYARLAAQHTEIANLRQGYVIVNNRYATALESLRMLSSNAREAMKRAEAAAQKAAFAAKSAADVASEVVAAAVTEAAATVAIAAKKAAAVIRAAADEAAAAAAEAAAAAALASAAATAAEAAAMLEAHSHETQARQIEPFNEPR